MPTKADYAGHQKYFDYLDEIENSGLIPTPKMTSPSLIETFPEIEQPKEDPTFYARQIIAKWAKAAGYELPKDY